MPVCKLVLHNDKLILRVLSVNTMKQQSGSTFSTFVLSKLCDIQFMLSKFDMSELHTWLRPSFLVWSECVLSFSASCLLFTEANTCQTFLTLFICERQKTRLHTFPDVCIYLSNVQLMLWSPQPRWLHVWTWRPEWSYRGSVLYTHLRHGCRTWWTLTAKRKPEKSSEGCVTAVCVCVCLCVCVCVNMRLGYPS